MRASKHKDREKVMFEPLTAKRSSVQSKTFTKNLRKQKSKKKAKQIQHSILFSKLPISKPDELTFDEFAFIF